MEFEIITREKGAVLHFLTQAKTIRGALRRLVNNSSDFKNVKEQRKVTIVIKQLEEEKK